MLHQVVERKRMDDLASSIVSHRYKEQKVCLCGVVLVDSKVSTTTCNKNSRWSLDIHLKELPTTKFCSIFHQHEYIVCLLLEMHASCGNCFKFRLKHCGLKRPIYLVESHGSMKNLSLSEDALQQAISNTQIIDQLYVKRTADVRESAAYLTVMTRRLQAAFAVQSIFKF